MNNTIPLPAGSFFCGADGRYLPGLTDLIIEALAMLQRREIEEQLLKLRLERGCFRALAERAPQAVLISPEPTGREAAPAENGAILSSNGMLEARVGCAPENPAAANPANPEGKPESNIGDLNSTGGGSRSQFCSIKVFPGSLSQQLNTKGDW